MRIGLSLANDSHVNLALIGRQPVCFSLFEYYFWCLILYYNLLFEVVQVWGRSKANR